MSHRFKPGTAATILSIISLLVSGFAVIYTVLIQDPVDRAIASITIFGAEGKECIEYSGWVQDRLHAGMTPKTIALITEMARRTSSEEEGSPSGPDNTSYYNPCNIKDLAGARLWIHLVQTGQLSPALEKDLSSTNP